MTVPRSMPIDYVIPDPHNERSESDQGAISRLADSIKQHGILQRLLVRPLENGRFMVVAGHRRLTAARTAGLERVPVEIRDIERTLGRLSQGSGNARDLQALSRSLRQIPAIKEHLLALAGADNRVFEVRRR